MIRRMSLGLAGIGLAAALLAAPASAQFRFEPRIRIPGWLIHCPRDINDAVGALDGDENSLAGETARLQNALESLRREFDDIKALTLVEATKDAGKIRVLSPLPPVAGTPAVPSFPRMDQYQCSHRMPDEYSRVASRLQRAAKTRDSKAAVVQALNDLKATYDEFKLLTADL